MAFNHYLHWGISIVSIDRVCLEYDSDQRLVIQIDPTASDEQIDMFIEIMQKRLAKNNIFISANVNELRYPPALTSYYTSLWKPCASISSLWVEGDNLNVLISELRSSFKDLVITCGPCVRASHDLSVISYTTNQPYFSQPNV